MEINIQQQTFELHPTGAVYWKEQKALLLADVHIGKVHHFRKSGIAVPVDVRDENLSKMDQLIAQYAPAEMYFLGDLFHSRKNKEWDAFHTWMQAQKIPATLVLGNHDIHAEVNDVLEHCIEKTMASVLLTHHPEFRKGWFNICGHIHPGMIMRGKGKLLANTPCFVQKQDQLILPAFGAFTGTQKIKPYTCLHIYLTTGDEVIQVK